MNLKDLKVSQKVALAFVGVLVATIILGIFALVRLSGVKATADDTATDGLPTVVALSHFQYATTRFRAFQASWIMPISEAERETHRKTFDKLQAQVVDALKEYRSLVTGPKEQELADRLEQSWNAYYALKPEYEEIFANKGIEPATTYLVGPSRKSFGVIVKATEDAIAANADAVKAEIRGTQEAYDAAKVWIIGLLLAASAIAIAMGVWLIRSVSSPLGAMTEAMDALARGNLDAHVPNADQADEIGKLAGSMTVFKGQLAAAERSKAEQTTMIVDSIGAGLAQLAKGDLKHRITAELTGAFAKLKHDFNEAAEKLTDTMRNVLSSTHQIATGAGEISSAADDLSRRTEQQAASLEETAAALEEITATVKKTASNAKDVNTSMASARSAAENGGRVVDSAVAAMDAISQSSKQITDITGVIDEIAFQTNLLALNAGVEAARAGDAGKGFAVVASEVRALAQRSSEAAKEIKTLIHASGEHVASGVKLVGESGAALRQIVDQVQHINSLVHEMAQAAEQQSTGIEEVNSAVGQMDQVTQQNAAMVEQSTAASRNLARETQVLRELVSFFQVDKSSAAAAYQGPAHPPVKAHSTQLHPPAAPRQAAAAVRATAAKTRAAPQDEWAEF